MILEPPDTVTARLGSLPASIARRTIPWIPLPWPLQSDRFGLYATAAATELDWARATAQLQLSHPPVPLAAPIAAATASHATLLFCWGLNRIVQAPLLDDALAAAGYDPAASRQEAVDRWVVAGLEAPESARVLGILELLYRQATAAEQDRLKTACGEDVMRAGYQLNMMCIDPDNSDRTLLQVQRIALKLCGAEAATIRQQMRLTLADGRTIDPL